MVLRLQIFEAIRNSSVEPWPRVVEIAFEDRKCSWVDGRLNIPSSPGQQEARSAHPYRAIAMKPINMPKSVFFVTKCSMLKGPGGRTKKLNKSSIILFKGVYS